MSRGSSSRLYLCVGALFGFIFSLFYLRVRPRAVPQFTVARNAVHAGGFDFGDAHLHRDNTTVADELSQKIRVFCCIVTSRRKLRTKAIHARDTWTKRCTSSLFISSHDDPDFPAIGLNLSDHSVDSYVKTNRIFRYIYEHHLQDADWFIKSDDDTYIILENLRYFLSDKNPNESVFFGHESLTEWSFYNSGAAYVLSQKALGILHDKGMKCVEETDVPQCMHESDITRGSTLDTLGRTRFHYFDPASHAVGELESSESRADESVTYENFPSDYAISFHEVQVRDMYGLEYLVYHLRPYGIYHDLQSLNP